MIGAFIRREVTIMLEGLPWEGPGVWRRDCEKGPSNTDQGVQLTVADAAMLV